MPRSAQCHSNSELMASCVSNDSPFFFCAPETKKLSKFAAKDKNDRFSLLWCKGDDLSQWTPSNDTRRCLKHLVNREKTTIKAHLSYLATILLPVYKKQSIAPGFLVALCHQLRGKTACQM